MAIISSFEVLAQPIAPGIPDIPYVQQGSFLQVTNVGNENALVTLLFNATPAFVAAAGAVALTANFITPTGAVEQVPPNVFLAPPVGFVPLPINPGDTWLFGVQYILVPSSGPVMLGGTPQDSAGTRGTVVLDASSGSKLLLLATTRQVFTNYTSAGAVLNVAESAYPVPLVGGPLHTY